MAPLAGFEPTTIASFGRMFYPKYALSALRKISPNDSKLHTLNYRGMNIKIRLRGLYSRNTTTI